MNVHYRISTVLLYFLLYAAKLCTPLSSSRPYEPGHLGLLKVDITLQFFFSFVSFVLSQPLERVVVFNLLINFYVCNEMACEYIQENKTCQLCAIAE